MMITNKINFINDNTIFIIKSLLHNNYILPYSIIKDWLPKKRCIKKCWETFDNVYIVIMLWGMFKTNVVNKWIIDILKINLVYSVFIWSSSTDHAFVWHHSRSFVSLMKRQKTNLFLFTFLRQHLKYPHCIKGRVKRRFI